MTRARSAWGPEHLGVKAAGTEGPWRLKDLCRPSLLWPLVGIALLSALLAFAFTTTAAIAPVVQTTSGRLKGHEAAGTSSVSEYLGVPYAEPPLGSLRWAPPERFNVSSDSPIVDATNFGHSCPAATSVSLSTNFSNTGGVNVTPQGAEILVSMLGQAGVTYSEDCLTLNIWTKAPFGEQKKAVLFWVHGGAYSTGTTNQPAYIGKYLAEQQDVVVVTANYRLNIFGFPGAPNLRNNLGLLDHRLALEWTRDNIAAFGGDPSRITLFGQSAGASAVDYYSYAWTSDAIIAGIIAQSGTVFSPGSQATPSDAASAWYNVTSTLGCGDANSNAQYVVQCMRSKEWEAVQDAMPRSSGLFGGGFGPTIDEIVVFSDYPARSVAGKLIKKPLMIGNNENEAGLFKPTLALQNISYSPEEWDALALVLFTCSVSTRALASIANGVPTWRYRWFGDFPDLKLTSTPNSGAWHGSEIPIIFGTDLDVQNVVDRTEAERRIISYMGGAWAAFAKDPTRGLTNYGMRRYSPLQPTLLQLAYNNLTGPNAVLPAKYDLSCPIPAILLGLASGLGLI